MIKLVIRRGKRFEEKSYRSSAGAADFIRDFVKRSAEDSADLREGRAQLAELPENPSEWYIGLRNATVSTVS